MLKRFIVLAAALLPLLHTTPLRAEPKLSLNLAKTKEMALQNNPVLSAALLNVAAALQVPTEYRAAYLPTVQGNVTGVLADSGSRLAAGGLNNPVLYDRVAAGLSVNQLVTDFGRTRELIDMAKLRADAQKASAEQTRADVLLVAGQAYFDVLRAQAVLRVARKTVAARQYLVDQVTALAENKLKTDLDVSFANVNLGDANVLLVQAENGFKAAQAQLAAVLGLPGDTAFTLAEEPMPPPSTDQTDALIRRALEHRPELKRLRLEVAADEKFVDAEHALKYPTLGIAGAAGVVPFGQSQVQDRYGAIGFNLNVPIFNGGLFKAREEKARLEAQASQQHLDEEAIKLARDVRLAWLDEKTAYDRVALSEKILKQAQIAFDLALSRYNLGLSSIVELSQSQLNLTTAQIAFASAKYDFQIKRLNVAYQTGELG
ncbi:TolC family protein [Geomesophilobacter sediminis]|uniref:TolC family protein n=1 Tax=Geomesophilobacter sediminis TaxID=2798584 RepID=A0A8J7IPZ7_9BACT|nr:TolC family protein [Geomesophilobacter sediminis]MBJ6725793.1 TolC family protein [Geomesophilobacter sediminis]